MIHSICSHCLQQYRLMVSPREQGLVLQVSSEEGKECPCPRLCGGSINLTGSGPAAPESAALRDPITMTGAELYRAVNGLGMADEIPKSKETVESVVKANRVKDVLIEESSGRFYLHELHLENGLIVHLAGGLRGAEVLKITREVGRAR